MSDYSLLEQAKRAVDAANAARPRNYRNHMNPPEREYPGAIPKHRMKMLANEAAKRGIDLRFLPKVYLRHRGNSSNVKPVKQVDGKPTGKVEEDNNMVSTKREYPRVMIWCLDVHFWGKDGGTAVVKTSSVDEDTSMTSILQGALSALKIKTDRMNGKEDPYIDYLDIAVDKLSAFLKNETGLIKRLADAPIKLPEVYLQKAKKRKMADGIHVETYDMGFDNRKFHAVSTTQTLREAMFSRSIVEYPVLHVTVKGSGEEKEMLTRMQGIFEKPEPQVSDEPEGSEDSTLEDEELSEEEGEVQEAPKTDANMKDAPPELTSTSIAEGSGSAGTDNAKKADGTSGDGLQAGADPVYPSSEMQKPPSDSRVASKADAEMKDDEQKNLSPEDGAEGIKLPESALSNSKPADESVQKERGSPNKAPAHHQSTTPSGRRKSRFADKPEVSKPEVAQAIGQGGHKEGADDTSAVFEKLGEGEVVGEGSEPGLLVKDPAQRTLATRKESAAIGSLTANTGSVKSELDSKGEAPPSPESGNEDGQSEKATEQDASEDKEEGKTEQVPSRSPQLPFAFEFDSTLLNDRIPRRKTADSLKSF